MLKIKIISESRGKKRKKNPRKLRIKKAKQTAARAEKLAIKNASKYMKFMRRIKPYIQKLPRGGTIYAALTSVELSHKGWEALNTAAMSMPEKEGGPYPDGHVWEAFKGTRDNYPPNHTFYMMSALFKWAKSSDTLLSAIPGYNEAGWVLDISKKISNWIKSEDDSLYSYIKRQDGEDPDDSDRWTSYPELNKTQDQ